MKTKHGNTQVLTIFCQTGMFVQVGKEDFSVS